MSPCRSVRSTSNVVWMTMALALGACGLAHAVAGDCTQIDAKVAASVLGVAAAQANPNQGVHSKLSPDNMDLLSCGYVEATVDPMARTLLYLALRSPRTSPTYTPVWRVETFQTAAFLA